MTLVTKLRIMGTALIGANVALIEATIRFGSPLVISQDFAALITLVTVICIHVDAHRAVDRQALEQQFMDSVNNIIAPYAVMVISLWFMVTPTPEGYGAEVVMQKIALIATASLILVSVPMVFGIMTKKLRS